MAAPRRCRPRIRAGSRSSSHKPGGWYGLTGGPPIVSTSRPLAARAASRSISAGNRQLRAACQQQVLGVARAGSGGRAERCR